MATFTITDPFGEVTSRIEIGLGMTRDMTPVFARGKPEWALSRVEEFRTRGGGTWPDYLSSEDGYVGYKLAVTGKANLLEFDKNPRALRLKKSLTQTNHPDFVYVISPLTVRLGTQVHYAQKLRTGGHTDKWGGVTTPPRDMLRPGDFDRRIARILGEYAGEIGDVIAGRDMSALQLRGA